MNLPTDTLQKSVLIIKAMGKYKVLTLLAVVDALVDGQRKHYWEYEGRVEEIPDLYDPANMAIAWRGLNWAATDRTMTDEYSRWISEVTLERVIEFPIPPAEAQAAWLDKILALAIEAGLVQLEAAQ